MFSYISTMQMHIGVQLFQLGALVLSVTSNTPPSTSKGCSASPVLPDLPFFVVWNHPSGQCEKRGVNFNFEKWGIVDNAKGNFYGNKINLLYSFGSFPYYAGKNPIHGGLPQLGNLTSHLAAVKKELGWRIHEKDFSGLGVIDFEKWRPLFYLNYDHLRIYQTESIELAKKKNPHMNKDQVKREAVKEFNNYARLFMEETLKELNTLRPEGKWGYYGYPRTWAGNTVGINDEMRYIFKQSAGLYPSIYFETWTHPQARAYEIHNKLRESVRLKAKYAPQDALIMPYSLCQDNGKSFFTDYDLSFAIGMPADIGASGVVLWGSSSYMRTHNECKLLQKYINETLGPFVKNVTQFFANCSQTQCSGHGRCVRKDYEAYYQLHLKESNRTECQIPEKMLMTNKRGFEEIEEVLQQHSDNPETSDGAKKETKTKTAGSAKYTMTYDFNDYVCKCYSGWTGSSCSQPM